MLDGGEERECRKLGSGVECVFSLRLCFSGGEIVVLRNEEG